MRPRSGSIVIGAGSAGALVAARLAAAQPVLLLEAGADHPAGPPPALAGPNFFAACRDPFIWHGLDARRTPHQAPRPYLRGRVVGGSSAVNAMVGLWGRPADYDRWGPAASWARTEAGRRDISARFGLWRPPPPRWSPIERALGEAALDAGHPWCDDPNSGPEAIGVGPAPLTVRAGRRISAADAYLGPLRGSPYLSVWGDAEVDRIVLDGRRAAGVRLRDGRELEADRVVVCAGAISSPLLLLRSGVEHPALGANLADHPSAPVTLLLRPAGRLPHPDRYVVNALVRYGSGQITGEDGAADMQLMAVAAVGTAADELGVAVLQAAVMRSFGRGRVSLDPAGAALIDFDLLGDERDRLRLRDGLRRAVALTRHRAVAELVDAVVLDGVGHGGAVEELLTDDDATDRWLERHTGDYVHACGTCRMGPADDPAAVVDRRDGAVFGYRDLHVIDASVLPQVPRANTHLSTVLVAQVLVSGLLAAAG
jgi:choline dehydrogenase-like flavoprotein